MLHAGAQSDGRRRPEVLNKSGDSPDFEGVKRVAHPKDAPVRLLGPDHACGRGPIGSVTPALQQS